MQTKTQSQLKTAITALEKLFNRKMNARHKSDREIEVQVNWGELYDVIENLKMAEQASKDVLHTYYGPAAGATNQIS